MIPDEILKNSGIPIRSVQDDLEDRQILRQDFVDNTIMQLLKFLDPSKNKGDWDWDIEAIGQVRDAVRDVYLEKGVCTEQEFYPYLET
jgi:hypothetical protein